MEILVATLIMSIGFLAASQMQFMAMKQKRLAVDGSKGSNFSQFIADYDFAEMKRRHLLNAAAYLDGQAGRTMDLSYCDNTPPAKCPEDTCLDPCTACPCNPLDIIRPASLTAPNCPSSPDPLKTRSIPDMFDSVPVVDGINPITLCTVTSEEDFNPSQLVFSTSESFCMGLEATVIAGAGNPIYISKVATICKDTASFPEILYLQLEYRVQSSKQYADQIADPTELNGKHKTMSEIATYLTAHIDDWSTVGGATWSQIVVPHMP